MLTTLFQDWTTAQAAGGLGVTQTAEAWLDCEHVENVVFWLELGGIGGTSPVNLYYETAPLRESALFVAMTPPLDLTAVTQNVAVVTPLLAQSAYAVSRWVRWRVASANAWNATFRIWTAVSGARVRG